MSQPRICVFGGRQFGFELIEYGPSHKLAGHKIWVPKPYVIEWFNKQLTQNFLVDVMSYRDPILVSGSCPTGADFLAEAWAAQHGVSIERHPADWSQGKSAGPKRNEEMASSGLACALQFTGQRGTTDMHNRCIKHEVCLFDFTDLEPKEPRRDNSYKLGQAGF